jgi:hypothetical protein
LLCRLWTFSIFFSHTEKTPQLRGYLCEMVKNQTVFQEQFVVCSKF